jgi:hypothetical protein
VEAEQDDIGAGDGEDFKIVMQCCDSHGNLLFK